MREKYQITFFLLALSIFLQSGLAVAKVHVVSHWVMPTGLGERPLTVTHERTRPIVLGDILYVGQLDGYVSAIHRTKGYLIWRTKLQDSIDGAMTFARSKLFAGDIQGNLYAIHARDGTFAWPKPFKIRSEWLSPPAVERDKVFVASSNNEFYALNETDGTEAWHYAPNPPADEKMEIRGTGGTTVLNQENFQGFANGFIFALSANRGMLLWSKKLRAGRPRFYDVDMAPWVDDKRVIVATYEGKLYSLERTSGTTEWVLNIGSYGGFLVEGKRLYVAGLDRVFYCIEKETGKIIWKTSFSDGVGLTPAKSGKYIILTTSSDPVYIFDENDGSIVWKGALGAGTMAPAATPTPADNWFYCISNYGNIHAFEIMEIIEKSGAPVTIATPSALERHRVSKPYSDAS